MDISTIIGFVSGTFFIIWAIMQSKVGLRPFWDFPSVLITIGGSAAAVMICFPLSALKELPKMMMIAFKPGTYNPRSVIEKIVELAEKARREGLLALEDSIAGADDLFLKRGIQLIVDGTDPELVRDILETDLNYIEDRHKSGKSIFDAITAYAPAYGMIGTLIGLVQMLRSLDDPSKIGPAMAVALVTTFYGAIVANFISGPVGAKLAIRNSEEIQFREMMLEGILSIQSGENPRIVEEKLMGFLAPRERTMAAKEAETRRGGRGQAAGTVAEEAGGGVTGR